MNKNYFLAVAKYEDENKQHFFDNVVSKRNKEYCEKHGIEYLEVTENIYPIRGKLGWFKMFKAVEVLNNILQEGDGLIYLDADALIVNTDSVLLPPNNKSFAYSIDTANTHCMGFFSLYKNEWSSKLMNLIIDENRYKNLIDVVSFHEGKKTDSSFWQEFYDQASFYSIAGIIRHSNISFWELPNYGWHSEKNEWTAYEVNELKKNVHVFPSRYNVTELPGESACINYINYVQNDEVVIRHFAGAQKWRKAWLNTNSIYFKVMKYNLLNSTTQYKIKSFYRKARGFVKSKLKKFF